MPMIERENTSLSDRVFETLEEEILTGVLQSGETVSENKLSARLGVSRTPVREALHRLEQEGLVSNDPGKGAVILGVTKQDLLDIYEIRLRIEGLAARLAAQSITESQIASMRELVELQEFYAAKGDSERIRDLDSRFHSMIYSFCTSRVLADTLRGLHHRIERFRRMSVVDSERASRTSHEHSAIIEALAAHDSDSAERLLIEHITNARDALNKML